jgi:uncharacterized membrane protein
MNKLAYLDALKRAMTGLAPAVQARTLAYYEQRFVDGVAAGRSEEAVAAELDDPRKIAMTLRASSHMAAFEEKRNPANFLRMAVSSVGLLIFNLLMFVPAAVYLSMLLALYSLAFGFYIIGIAVTASGLAGANELVLNRPFGIVLSDDSDGSESRRQTHVSISESGIHVFDEGRERDRDNRGSRNQRRTLVDNDVAMKAARQAEKAAIAAQRAAEQAGESAERAGARAAAAAEKAALAAMAAAGTPVDRAADAADAADAAEAADAESIADSDKPRAAEVIRRAERVAGRAIRITTDVDAGSRTTQTAFGLAMVVGSILLFLLSLVISRYTLIGIKRYFQMNLSLLKGS